MIGTPGFPCVGAKSALASDNVAVETAGTIIGAQDDSRIHDLLVDWGKSHRPGTDALHSLAVVFASPTDLSEAGFEAALWDRLGTLTAIDRARGHSHDPKVSADPCAPDFAVSFGGRAFFVIGLHPGASRRARRAPFPALVFNLHDQFIRLRQEQKYERMREVILMRDTAFDGTPNPMLARHGEISEARQYSGRAVGTDWVCPFAPARNPA